MHTRLLLAVSLIAGAAAAQPVDLAINGCSASDPAADYFDPFDEEVTFLALGDPQYPFASAAYNDAVIHAMNQASTLVWPTIIADDGEELGAAPVSNIRGVVVAGDLTHNNTDAEWNQFSGAYGLCANKALDYPVYEGWGNHDVVTSPDPNTWIPTPLSVVQPAVADYVAFRNPYRPLIQADAGGRDGHYRWRWRDITFIQLNLEPTEMARGALSFLDAQLDLIGPNAPVIVVTHYGFGTWNNEPDANEQRAYDNVIREHNVVAHLHGHDHATSTYTWSVPPPRHLNSYSVPMFNLGSPVVGVNGHRTGDNYVHFTAFRITADHIIACDVRAAPSVPNTPEFTPVAEGGWCRAATR